MIGDIDRGIPERHDQIADELVERAFVCRDVTAERIEQRVQESHERCRRQTFADLGEASHIDEHHRQLAIVSAKAQRVRRILDAMEQRWRQILAEGMADLAALAVADQEAERGRGEMGDRAGDDWRQRVKEQSGIGKGEPRGDKRRAP